ncbi:MAG: nucleoside/nucleotide kinase family protein [Actinomycetota bacterium]
MSARLDADEFIAWVARRTAEATRSDDRLLLGLTGPPGSGKSTLAERIRNELGGIVAPMDGFHLPNAALDRLGRRHRKGAPDTFDALRFTERVERLASGAGDVEWPTFDRRQDEPIECGVTVPADANPVIVEGNYLLLDDEPWVRIRPLLDDIAYLDLDAPTRTDRLVARHVAFGRTPTDAARFVRESDEMNTASIERGLVRASIVVDVR